MAPLRCTPTLACLLAAAYTAAGVHAQGGAAAPPSTPRSVAICPPTLGVATPVWASLRGFSNSYDLHAVLFITANGRLGGNTSAEDGAASSYLPSASSPGWLDRTWVGSADGFDGNSGLGRLFVGDLYVDRWAGEAADLNATHMAVFILNQSTLLGSDVYTPQVRIAGAVPGRIRDNALAWAVVRRPEVALGGGATLQPCDAGYDAAAPLDQIEKEVDAVPLPSPRPSPSPNAGAGTGGAGGDGSARLRQSSGAAGPGGAFSALASAAAAAAALLALHY